MRQAWRWFGPNDPVTLDTVRQAGATDIVSSLHHVPPGEAWTLRDVERHRDLIETTSPGRSPLNWSVIESIPLADHIKRHGAGAKQSIAARIASLEAAAQAGLKIICYNFMPVVDWTRADLDWPLPTGGRRSASIRTPLPPSISMSSSVPAPRLPTIAMRGSVRRWWRMHWMRLRSNA